MKGKFKARAKTWDLGETAKGGEEIAVSFEILVEDPEFTHLTWHGYFTNAAWERTIESMRHMGWEGEDLRELSGLDKNEVELVVEEEEYQGKIQTKVQWVNRLGSLALKAPLTAERRQSFAASMKDKIRALDAAKGQRKPSAAAPRNSAVPGTRPEPPPHSDEDNLPF